MAWVGGKQICQARRVLFGVLLMGKLSKVPRQTAKPKGIKVQNGSAVQCSKAILHSSSPTKFAAELMLLRQPSRPSSARIMLLRGRGGESRIATRGTAENKRHRNTLCRRDSERDIQASRFRSGSERAGSEWV